MRKPPGPPAPSLPPLCPLGTQHSSTSTNNWGQPARERRWCFPGRQCISAFCCCWVGALRDAGGGAVVALVVLLFLFQSGCFVPRPSPYRFVCVFYFDGGAVCSQVAALACAAPHNTCPIPRPAAPRARCPLRAAPPKPRVHSPGHATTAPRRARQSTRAFCCNTF